MYQVYSHINRLIGLLKLWAVLFKQLQSNYYLFNYYVYAIIIKKKLHISPEMFSLKCFSVQDQHQVEGHFFFASGGFLIV